MKGINKRIIAIVLIFVVFLTNLPVAIFASDIEGSDNEPKTNWLGDKATIDVESGTYPYVFMLAQDISNNYYYYETSNHTVQVTGGGAVHLIPMVDTQIVSGEWHPDGIYECGLSNYDVLYCCDAATGTGDGTYYKRANLEDSEYYSELDAKRLRAIVYNSYPYVSVEEAKAFLKEAGFEYADKLDRSELISATQAAIWTIANADSGDTYNYVTTATTGQLRKWGGFFHDFSPEITNFTDSTKASRKPYEEIRTRVDALKAFLLSLDPVDAENKQIVITELDVSRSKISRAENLYAVELKVTLNQGADNNDDVVLRTYVNGVETDVTVRVGRDTEYTLRVNAKANDTIKVTASGTQKLERGAYFYVPEPMDIDGDGIATSREVSQNLIGVAMGETPVYAEKSYVVDVVNVDLEINKVDPNGVALSGAMFALSTADGKHIETKKVNRFGKLVFNDLMPGKYYINEVVAPTGYILIESRIELIVHDDGSITFDGKWSESKPVVGDGIEVKSGDVTVDLVEDGSKTHIKYYYSSVDIVNYPEKTSIAGIKIWNDDNDRDGIRPDSVIIKLHANGKIIATVEVTAETGWRYVFTDLDKYSNGNKIIYTVVEEPVKGYAAEYNGFNVINTHIPETVDIEGSKIWNDGNNQDGIRPESIVINLLANGEIVDTVEVTAADEWKYSFTGLAKYENGVEIVYTIEEVAVDGYETTYDGYNVINTHIVRTSITLDGIKYLDADVAEGFTFVLTDVNGNKIATVVSGADGKFTFAELVYTEEGTYVYYISEIIGEDDEIIYDETIYTVTVVVTSDGEKLNASVTLAKDGVSYEGDIEFFNETETVIPDDPTPLDPPKESNPETGDNTSVIALVIAGAIVTLGVVIKSKSRRFE